VHGAHQSTGRGREARGSETGAGSVVASRVLLGATTTPSRNPEQFHPALNDRRALRAIIVLAHQEITAPPALGGQRLTD
jgi:hypothetical protein